MSLTLLCFEITHRLGCATCLLRQAFALLFGEPRRNPMGPVQRFDRGVPSFAETQRLALRPTHDIMRLAREQAFSPCSVAEQLHGLRYARQVGLDDTLQIRDLPPTPAFNHFGIKPFHVNKHISMQLT